MKEIAKSLGEPCGRPVNHDGFAGFPLTVQEIVGLRGPLYLALHISLGWRTLRAALLEELYDD